MLSLTIKNWSFMKYIKIFVIFFVSFVGMSACSKVDSYVEDNYIEQTDAITPIATRSVGSGIDLKPDNTWITLTQYSVGSKIRVFKENTSDVDTYVTAVDLSTGAKVVPYYEFQTGQTNATSTNPNPKFLGHLVSDFNMTSLGWYSVTNLGFFDGTKHLSFMLRKNGILVSSGYGTFLSSEPKRRTVAIYGTAATVYEGPGNNNSCNVNSSTGKANLYNATVNLYSSATHVMTGLHPTLANKDSSLCRPRTFVGIRQHTPLTNGGPVYVYILTTTSMTQLDAYNRLIGFGCDGSEIVMFDGGGSTQMRIGSNTLIHSSSSPYREVPLFIVVKTS